MTHWGAVDTRLLTQRGMLNRESESFGETLWGSLATVMVAVAAQKLSFELENPVRAEAGHVNPLAPQGYENAPRTLAGGA